MSGPIGIAHGLHNLAQVSFLLVLWFVVLINVNLAILNLLPLPVLDGGHMVFATLAKIRGRDLPSEFVQTVQAAFIVILLGLFVYVSFFDTSRVIRDIRELRQVQEATPTPPSPPPEPVQAP
jgi:regulator of sigma E protease